MLFHLGIHRRISETFPDFYGLSKPYCPDAKREQPFEQVVNGNVGVSHCEDGSKVLLCPSLENAHAGMGLPSSRWALDQSETPLQSG